MSTCAATARVAHARECLRMRAAAGYLRHSAHGGHWLRKRCRCCGGPLVGQLLRRHLPCKVAQSERQPFCIHRGTCCEGWIQPFHAGLMLSEKQSFLQARCAWPGFATIGTYEDMLMLQRR